MAEKKPRIRIDLHPHGVATLTKSAVVKAVLFAVSQPNLEVLSDPDTTVLALQDLPLKWTSSADNVIDIDFAGNSVTITNGVITECWLPECINSSINDVLINLIVSMAISNGFISQVLTQDDFA